MIVATDGGTGTKTSGESLESEQRPLVSPFPQFGLAGPASPSGPLLEFEPSMTYAGVSSMGCAFEPVEAKGRAE